MPVVASSPPVFSSDVLILFGSSPGLICIYTLLLRYYQRK